MRQGVCEQRRGVDQEINKTRRADLALAALAAAAAAARFAAGHRICVEGDVKQRKLS